MNEFMDIINIVNIRLKLQNFNRRIGLIVILGWLNSKCQAIKFSQKHNNHTAN